MKYDYRTFWRAVTNDGKNPCAMRGTECHRCNGTGERTFNPGYPDPQTEDSAPCSACVNGWSRCKGGKDAHHYIPKRRINLKLGGKHSPRAIAARMDVRNGVCLCRGHHDLVEGGQMVSPVPETLSFFCADHGLELPAAARENRVLWDRNSPAAESGVTEDRNSLGGPESGPFGDDHDPGGQLRIEPASEDVAADPD